MEDALEYENPSENEGFLMCGKGFNRGVNCTDKCEYCMSNYENEWHIFFSCQKAQELWEIASLWGMISGEFGTADGFKSLLFFHMLEQLEQDQLIAFVTGLWCIWKRRNDKIWEDRDTA